MTFLHVRKNYDKKCRRRKEHLQQGGRIVSWDARVGNSKWDSMVGRGQQYKIKNTFNSKNKKRNYFPDRCLTYEQENKKTQIFLQNQVIYFGHLDNQLSGGLLHCCCCLCTSYLLYVIYTAGKAVCSLSFIVSRKTHHPLVSHHNMNWFPVFVHWSWTQQSVRKICLSALDSWGSELFFRTTGWLVFCLCKSSSELIVHWEIYYSPPSAVDLLIVYLHLTRHVILVHFLLLVMFVNHILKPHKTNLSLLFLPVLGPVRVATNEDQHINPGDVAVAGNHDDSTGFAGVGGCGLARG